MEQWCCSRKGDNCVGVLTFAGRISALRASIAPQLCFDGATGLRVSLYFCQNFLRFGLRYLKFIGV